MLLRLTVFLGAWLFLASGAMAQASGLGSPRPRGPAPGAPAPAAPAPGGAASALRDEMSRSTTAPPGAGTLAVFEDGHRDAVPWQEDWTGELDPPGIAHVVLGAGGSVLAADGRFGLAGRGELALLLDLCLYDRLSLHLRVGPAGAYQSHDSGLLQTEMLTAGGRLLVGLHLAQTVAVRLGFEIGAAFVDVGELRPVAWGAGLVELGVRFGDGRVELGVQGAIVSRAAAELDVGGTFHEAIPAGESPRLGGYLGVTL